MIAAIGMQMASAMEEYKILANKVFLNDTGKPIHKILIPLNTLNSNWCNGKMTIVFSDNHRERRLAGIQFDKAIVMKIPSAAQR